MGCDIRKPVFGISDQVKLKLVNAATETNWKIEISLVASLDILFKKRTRKGLIRLCVCADWSAPLLFRKPRRQVFSRQGPYKMGHHWLASETPFDQ